MTSDTTLSSEIDLQRSFSKNYLEVPTMTSGTDIFIQAACESQGDYRRVNHEVPNTSSVQSHTFVIGSATTQKMVPIPSGFRYLKVELSTAMTATAVIFKVICSD